MEFVLFWSKLSVICERECRTAVVPAQGAGESMNCQGTSVTSAFVLKEKHRPRHNDLGGKAASPQGYLVSSRVPQVVSFPV